MVSLEIIIFVVSVMILAFIVSFAGAYLISSAFGSKSRKPKADIPEIGKRKRLSKQAKKMLDYNFLDEVAVIASNDLSLFASFQGIYNKFRHATRKSESMFEAVQQFRRDVEELIVECNNFELAKEIYTLFFNWYSKLIKEL